MPPGNQVLSNGGCIKTKSPVRSSLMSKYYSLYLSTPGTPGLPSSSGKLTVSGTIEDRGSVISPHHFSTTSKYRYFEENVFLHDNPATGCICTQVSISAPQSQFSGKILIRSTSMTSWAGAHCFLPRTSSQDQGPCLQCSMFLPFNVARALPTSDYSPFSSFSQLDRVQGCSLRSRLSLLQHLIFSIASFPRVVHLLRLDGLHPTSVSHSFILNPTERKQAAHDNLLLLF